MTTDIHSLALGRMGCAQPGMMNVVPPYDESLAIATVHREGIVSGLKDLAFFKGDVISANETHAGTAALEPQTANDQVRTIHELNVVLSVAAIGRMRQQRTFPCRSTDNNRPLRGPFHCHRAPIRLRIRSTVQDQFISWPQCVRHFFELLIRGGDCRTDFIDASRSPLNKNHEKRYTQAERVLTTK